MDRLIDDAYLQRLYDSDILNSQYVMTIICEEYEKNLYEGYMSKVLMNG